MICGLALAIGLYALCEYVAERLANFHKRDRRPPEGSIYTHKKRGAYNGMTGVVHHHGDGKHFMINTGSSWLCNIKP